MRLTQAFEITKWDQSTYDDSGDLTLGRAAVGKTFTAAGLEDAGLEGTSTAELLMVGSFMMVHGASADQTSSPGKIVAADGDLTGLTGTVVYEHDDRGPRVTLDYELP
jgi:hypothetical protein